MEPVIEYLDDNTIHVIAGSKEELEEVTERAIKEKIQNENGVELVEKGEETRTSITAETIEVFGNETDGGNTARGCNSKFSAISRSNYDTSQRTWKYAGRKIVLTTNYISTEGYVKNNCGAKQNMTDVNIKATDSRNKTIHENYSNRKTASLWHSYTLRGSESSVGVKWIKGTLDAKVNGYGGRLKASSYRRW